MPYRDRTGPAGEGPLTGWGLGTCGKGLAFGRGAFGRGAFGRGARSIRRPYPYQDDFLTDEEEEKIFEARLKELKNAKTKKEKTK